MVILVVAIFGLSLLIGSFFKQYIEDKTIQSLSRQLTYIETISNQNMSNMNSVLANIRELNGYNLRLTMIHSNGRVFFDSEKQMQG